MTAKSLNILGYEPDCSQKQRQRSNQQLWLNAVQSAKQNKLRLATRASQS